MPELRHAEIGSTGEILFRGAPLVSTFNDFVQRLREGKYSEDGRERSGSSLSQKQDASLAEARRLFGSASIKRYLLATSLARETSPEIRRRLLDRLGVNFALLGS